MWLLQNDVINIGKFGRLYNFLQFNWGTWTLYRLLNEPKYNTKYIISKIFISIELQTDVWVLERPITLSHNYKTYSTKPDKIWIADILNLILINKIKKNIFIVTFQLWQNQRTWLIVKTVVKKLRTQNIYKTLKELIEVWKKIKVIWHVSSYLYMIFYNFQTANFSEPSETLSAGPGVMYKTCKNFNFIKIGLNFFSLKFDLYFL